MSTLDEIETMLEDIEQRESRLADWERGFIESICEQLGRGGSLTGPQDDKLTEIWERIC